MKTSKLGDLVSITIGRTPSRSDPDFWDKEKSSGNVWLSIADLLQTDGKIVSDSKEYITDDAAKAFTIIPKGTLLVSFKLTLGRLAYAGCDLRTNEAVAALHNDESIVLNDYLYNYLSYFDWAGYAAADQKVKGLTLNKAKVNEIPIFYPESIDDQRQVVTRLNTALEKIDRAIGLTKKNISNVRDLYDHTFQKSLGTVAGETVLLEDVCEITSRLVDPRTAEFIDMYHVGGANIESKTGKLTGLKTSREEGLISGKFPFDENTVLYSKIRPYLMKVARPNFKGICSADIYPLSAKNKMTKDYLYYLLLSPDFTNYAISGSERAGMPKVNREHLFAYELRLPDLESQAYIVKELDQLSKRTDELLTSYGRKIHLMDSLKKSLLNKTFMRGAVE